MPHAAASDRPRDRIHALFVVCVLAVASLVIAFLGAAPSRVTSRELLGDTRTPGEAAFIASHRGGAATAPENTLPAVTAALAGGFEYVEVDVALTADRHPVLMHDNSVDRTTDGHGRLAALTLAEVRALDAGAWFDEAYAGTPVPTLDEFLDLLVTADGRAIVELKGEWDAAAVDAAVAAVAARGLERRIVFASFDARTLALAAAGSKVLSRLLILKQVPSDVVSAVAEAGARGVVVNRKAVLARPEIVDELHDAGARVVVYTLNDDDQWDAVTALGVDGIVTDDPHTLSEWQSAYAGP
ncbi:glycerophosphodiester phosphodiesterase family protein [Microbacterium sp. M3]|uniref:Glycerophosphodiester phosphodiesterase family protein n=1 Tax=Microbacterium arthrosphaerae TaxID=792652 RepID=A0ABU4H1F0_9MICO|nr:MULTISPECIES: glycerophosphodiester phosphodiesterase family protein [Microbacterium]MDW4573158.1 glycerophosphodiester phosphodiesterase family protein [Microbacterium arthrosphaerae]MDW7607013.1 glycerophosphodiester phosphodiesterase family protein [Microbacterium sp. M3]